MVVMIQQPIFAKKKGWPPPLRQFRKVNWLAQEMKHTVVASTITCGTSTNFSPFLLVGSHSELEFKIVLVLLVG
jgi:hypothetical protein